MILSAGMFLIIILIVVISASITIYNGLISLRKQVDRAWANIDIIMKQRFDEIPQLIQILEQFAQYEKSMVQKVIDARSKYGSANSNEQKIEASKDMSVALRGIIAIGEAYPELKSNANFVQIQTRLSSLEGNIADRREIYNETVTNWNTRILQFPDVIFANMAGYQELPLFQISKEEKALPNLKMNLGI